MLAKSDTFKYLCASVRAYGRDAHLRHNLKESLVDCLDVVGLGSGIVFLYLVALHEVVEYGKRHIRTKCRSPVAQQQSGVHGFAYLTALNYQCRLHAFAYADEIMVYGTHSEQRRYIEPASTAGIIIHAALVGQDDIVIAFVDSLLSVFA